jgi:DNA-binding CsgD family transcriptional regulator
MVADLCRFMGVQLTGRGHVSARDARDAALLAKAAALLSPRERQTLDRLLAGDSEKQIAVHLGVSPHTVHVYVKNLYRQFDVCARGELLARFVNPSNHRI